MKTGIVPCCIHLSALRGHVSSLSSTEFGHIDGQEDVRPHDREDNQRVKGVVLDEEVDSRDQNIKDHRKDLEEETFQKGVHGAATAECTGHLTNLLAQMKVHGQTEDVLKGSTGKAPIQVLRDGNPQDSTSSAYSTLATLQTAEYHVKSNIPVWHATISKLRDEDTHLSRDQNVDDSLSNQENDT